MANKSDELATKEMPFRCYVGYDSHEDITFEVSLRVFVSYSVSFFASLGGGGGGGGGVAVLDIENGTQGSTLATIEVTERMQRHAVCTAE